MMTDDDPDQQDHLASGRMTIWEHIAEFRTRLIRCVIAVMLGMVIGWVIYPYVLEILLIPFHELVPGRNLIVTDPLDGFTTRIKVSAYLGIVLAMPVWLWQLWRFVTPGLYPKEKRYAIPFIASSILLFTLGAAIAFYTLNPALQFLIGVSGANVEPFYTPDSYITLITYMMLAFGFGFQFPVLLVALQIAGVLTPSKLAGWWRQAMVVIVIVAAVITPSGDPISMMALAVPMYIFYLMSIGIGVLFLRRQRKKAAKESAEA